MTTPEDTILELVVAFELRESSIRTLVERLVKRRVRDAGRGKPRADWHPSDTILAYLARAAKRIDDTAGGLFADLVENLKRIQAIVRELNASSVAEWSERKEEEFALRLYWLEALELESKKERKAMAEVLERVELPFKRP